MKEISNGLQSHLGQELTTLAELVKITRRDGVITAFTSHDADLTFDGVTYRADGAFTPGKMTEEGKNKANDYDVAGILDSTLIAEEDLKTGLYDHARIDVYLCNWADLSQGVIAMRRGWLGEVAISDGQYKASLRGFHDLLTRKIGETYTPECRYDLGDGRCGADLTALTYTGTVTGLVDERQFVDWAQTQSDQYFKDAKLTWTSGSNGSASYEVSAWDLDTQTFTLWLPTTYPIAVGDGYSVTAGCDKRFATCRTRFNNALNYGGFPYLPGLSKILQYPDGS